ncbi:MAG TPA: hypothetical protein VFH51_13640, partial [Myxococcota bacterium]|nr:hypothetical protein [Myxococcota bacterium]
MSWMVIGARSVLLWAALAEPGTQSPLIMTRPGQDLSAYRFDSDVFGWSRDFRDVAAVGAEVRRGPEGRQRGEAFLLVHRVGETVPRINVICHNITHADLPHDPVPLDDARDLMWVIENRMYIEMWPVRPIRKRPPHGMAVRVLWDPMEDVVAHPDTVCTPGVAFVLEHKGKRRVQPHQGVDMHARCDLIEQTDARIYWGRSDIAAA